MLCLSQWQRRARRAQGRPLRWQGRVRQLRQLPPEDRRFLSGGHGAFGTPRNRQAEDELASIGMALGAGWAGARSMTATAGPGISLMSEFIGLGYYAEIPTVVFNVE